MSAIADLSTHYPVLAPTPGSHFCEVCEDFSGLLIPESWILEYGAVLAAKLVEELELRDDCDEEEYELRGEDDDIS